MALRHQEFPQPKDLQGDESLASLPAAAAWTNVTSEQRREVATLVRLAKVTPTSLSARAGSEELRRLVGPPAPRVQASERSTEQPTGGSGGRSGVHAIQMELAQSTYLATEAAPFAYDDAKAERLRVHLKTILETLAALAPSLGGRNA
jgi:hypothetical protein